jgi:hypothetical protein
MSIKLYELTCDLKGGVRKIKIISKNEDFNEHRINRELFGKGKIENYKILNNKILIDNLGL